MLPKEILRKIRRLEIKTSRLVEGSVAGGYLSTFKGRGIEFTEVREYFEGDDVRTIDWNVTARMGAPFVKTFMEERDLTVVIAVDLSGSMEFGTTSQSKKESALDFAAAAALLAAKNNDRVGLLAYTDHVEKYIPPRKGKRHAMSLLADLAAIVPQGKGTNHAVAAAYLMNTVKTRSTLFWVSDFANITDPRPLKGASKRHELVPVLLVDRREMEFPGLGLVEMFDPETGNAFLVDTSSKAFTEAFGNMLADKDAARDALFKSLKSEPLEVYTGGSPIPALTRYFKRKARLGRH